MKRLIIALCAIALLCAGCSREENPASSPPATQVVLMQTPATAQPLSSPTPLPTPVPQNRRHTVREQGGSVYVVEEDEALRTEFQFHFQGDNLAGITLTFTSYVGEQVGALISLAESMGYEVTQTLENGLIAEAMPETVEGLSLLYSTKEALLEVYS